MFISLAEDYNYLLAHAQARVTDEVRLSLFVLTNLRFASTWIYIGHTGMHAYILHIIN